MEPFAFHPKLFEFRAAVLEVLSENGFAWLSHFGSIDLLHDLYGIEVCAISQEEDAHAIARLLGSMFPDWCYRRTYYEDQNLGEIGWKVIISRDPEGCEGGWLSAN